MILSANQAIPGRLRTVFLDRDGILNEKMPEGLYVTRWQDFRVLAGVPEALRRLNEAGLRVIVVSNQRGIALGLYTAADVVAIHTAFQQMLNRAGACIDAFFICPHDQGQCNCRKPLPGSSSRLKPSSRTSRPRPAQSSAIFPDIEFGRNLGMKTILVQNQEERPAPKRPGNLPTCASFPCPSR